MGIGRLKLRRFNFVRHECGRLGSTKLDEVRFLFIIYMSRIVAGENFMEESSGMELTWGWNLHSAA